MPTLTKAQIVGSIQKQFGFTRNRSIELVETLLEVIKKTLEKGEDVVDELSFEVVSEENASDLLPNMVVSAFTVDRDPDDRRDAHQCPSVVPTGMGANRPIGMLLSGFTITGGLSDGGRPSMNGRITRG